MGKFVDGASKGMGRVEFQTEEDAERAVASLNGVTLDGREMRVELEDRYKRASNTLVSGSRRSPRAS